MSKKHLLFYLLLSFIFIGQAQNPLILHENFNGSTFPPEGWSQIRTNANPANQTKKWTQESSRTYEGSGSAKIMKMPNGNINNLVSPQVTIPSANSYEIRFWMYRSANFSGRDKSEEGVKVWVSNTTDTIAGTKLMHIRTSTYQHPVISDIGWYQYTATIPMSGNVYVIFQGVSENASHSYIDEVEISQIPLCSAPTMVETITSTTESISLAWDDSVNSAWTISYQNTSETVWQTVVASEQPYTLGGLSSASTYNIRIFAHCADNSFSFPSETVTTNTACDIISSFPWVESFEGLWTDSTSPQNRPAPLCWTILNHGNQSNYHYWKVATSSAQSGTQYATCYADTKDTLMNNWLISPKLDLSSNGLLSFWVKRKVESTWGWLKQSNSTPFEFDKFSVWITAKETLDTITSDNPETGFKNIYPSTTIPIGDWVKIEIDLREYSGIYNLAFVRQGPSSDKTFLCLDNIEIRDYPSCMRPLEVNITPSISSADIIIGHTDPAHNSWILSIKSDTSATFVDIPFGHLPYEIENLSPKTSYKAVIKALCDNNETSEPSDSIVFRTLCETLNSPILEGFNSSPFPCWVEKEGRLQESSILHDVKNKWRYTPRSYVSGMDAHMFINLCDDNDYCWFISPLIDLGEGLSQLEFDILFSKSISGGNPSGTTDDNRFAVVISTDGGSTWSSENAWIWDSAGTYRHFDSLNITKQHIVIPLIDNNQNPYSGVVQIAFYGESAIYHYGTDNYLHIDNIQLSPEQQCIVPSNLNISSVFDTGAILSFEAHIHNSIWEYEIVEEGENFSGIATGEINETPFPIPALKPHTHYKIHIRAKCDETNFSQWSEETTFSTLVAPLSLPWSCDFEIDSINDYWNFENKRGLNHWIIDSATNNGGKKSLYIGDSSSNIYNWNNYSTAYAFIDLNFESNISHTLSFDWKCVGESQYDFLKIFLQNVEEELPSLDSLNTKNVIAFHLNRPYLSENNTWKNTQILLPDSIQGNQRLIFAWRNDFHNGNNPPAAIDNIVIREGVPCPTPAELFIDDSSSTSDVHLAWTRDDEALSWVIEFDNQEIHVNENTYTLFNLPSGETYTIRIRTLCEPTIFSDWTSPASFTTKAPIPSVVITNQSSNITPFSAQLHASIQIGNDHIAGKGFEWKKTDEIDYSDISASTENGNDFSALLTGLTANNSYSFRAFILVDSTKIYGEEKTFQTQNLGLNSLHHELAEIHVYPNPVQDKIFINIHGLNGEISIFLTDTQGKVLISKKIWNEHGTQKTSMKIKGITPGIYYLRFLHEEKSFIEKVIVQ